MKAFREVLGSRAVKRPRFDFRGATEDADRFRKTAVAFEDLAVAAYKAQAPLIQSRAYLVPALAIHSVEARHAAWIRRLAGEVPAADAFDEPRSKREHAGDRRRHQLRRAAPAAAASRSSRGERSAGARRPARRRRAGRCPATRAGGAPPLAAARPRRCSSPRGRSPSAAILAVAAAARARGARPAARAVGRRGERPTRGCRRRPRRRSRSARRSRSRAIATRRRGPRCAATSSPARGPSRSARAVGALRARTPEATTNIVLPLARRRPLESRVRLPALPNGTTGLGPALRARRVRDGPHAADRRPRRRRLTLLRDGRAVLRVPVGVGAAGRADAARRVRRPQPAHALSRARSTGRSRSAPARARRR